MQNNLSKLECNNHKFYNDHIPWRLSYIGWFLQQPISGSSQLCDENGLTLSSPDILDNILVIWMVMAPPGSYLTYYKNYNEF